MFNKQWTLDERYRVAAQARVLMDQDGHDAATAYHIAQQGVLPETRWKTRDQLASSNSQSHGKLLLKWIREVKTTHRRYLKTAPAVNVSPAPVVAGSATASWPDKAAPKRTKRPVYEGRTVWTLREKALIAQQLEEWTRAGQTNNRSLETMVIDAQELVLPVDRRRSVMGIRAGRARGETKALYELGLKNLHLLEQPAPPPPEVPTVPPPAPQITPESAMLDPAPEPAPATQVTTTRHAVLDSARAFGATLSSALDVLLTEQRTHLLNDLRARVDDIAGGIAIKLQDQIRILVHSALEQELGPVASAAPAPQAEPTQPTEPAQPQERLPKVAADVVGLIGPQITVVKQANELEFKDRFDLRFIDADEAGHWKPRSQNCILLRGFTSRTAVDKCKQWRVTPLYANGGAPSVIHCLRQLIQQQHQEVH